MKRTSRFYSKRTFRIVIVCVCAGIVAINGIIVGYSHFSGPQSQKSELDQKSESKVDRSVDRSLSYTYQNVAQFHDSQKLFLHYLHRKFELEPKLPKEAIGNNLQFRSPSRQEIDFLYRIVDPDKTVLPPLPEDMQDINLVNIYSANCDTITLPKNFWSLMQRQVDKGGYEMTHVALALTFMRDNGCALPPVASTLQEQVTTGMKALAQDPMTSIDLRYESITFLLLLQRFDLVDSTMIDTIIANQLENGGWSDSADGKTVNDHTTLLALWALLEYSHPDQPYEPLIQRPTQLP